MQNEPRADWGRAHDAHRRSRPGDGDPADAELLADGRVGLGAMAPDRAIGVGDALEFVAQFRVALQIERTEQADPRRLSGNRAEDRDVVAAVDLAEVR